MSSKFDRFGFLQYDAEKNTGMYPPDPGDTIFDDAFRHCPGWTNLLLSFCEKVTALFEFYHMDANKSLVILQAKEKFGGIRIYCENTPNRQLNRKLDTLCTNRRSGFCPFYGMGASILYSLRNRGHESPKCPA